ncbi:hypothetical protein P886_0815 [Alteromonadaceae bacterium 2753L.S.0a.02]|nr:hypothetical protein P886_0815 [Alteromonadaceae bacterium 2753L.S.0a.02]
MRYWFVLRTLFIPFAGYIIRITNHKPVREKRLTPTHRGLRAKESVQESDNITE